MAVVRFFWIKNGKTGIFNGKKGLQENMLGKTDE